MTEDSKLLNWNWHDYVMVAVIVMGIFYIIIDATIDFYQINNVLKESARQCKEQGGEFIGLSLQQTRLSENHVKNVCILNESRYLDKASYTPKAKKVNWDWEDPREI